MMENMSSHMKEKIFLGICFLVSIALTSCTSITTLESGAENVKIVANKIPNNCNFRGKVSISESNIYGPAHKTVQIKQLNQLKNQASKLGANVINVTSHQTKYYEHPEYLIAEGRMQWELDAHAMSGLAYFCPSNELSQIGQRENGKITDVRAMDE